MERKLGYITPGVVQFPKEFFYDLERKDFIRLPDVDAINKIYSDIKDMSSEIYIKLHGSYGWLSYDSADNNAAMVIGKNKEKDIEKEPILKEYYKIFKDVINLGNKKLLIIGYGFGDEHINNIIKKGVEEHNLSLYIINTITPKEFTEKIITVHDPMWQAVRGYFPYSLKEILPLNGVETTQFLEIKNVLLN
jgi:hypothetical protein